MKKNLLAILMCVIVSMAFTSCEDDGWYTEDAPFLGTWYGVNNNASFFTQMEAAGIPMITVIRPRFRGIMTEMTSTYI